MIIKDPIYGFIKCTNLAKKIIDTEEFQRLRDIKQLSVCYYLFPSATHTRFEHSLGVYHLTKIFINNIKENSINTEFNERNLELITIAALIHDIGHIAFSHMFDHQILYNMKNIDNDLKEHEDRSCILIKYMNNKYDLNIKNKELILIKNLIKGKIMSEYPHWYFEIVANYKTSIDTDKIDYLLRDSYHIGLQVNFDYRYLINNVKIINNYLCYNEKIGYTIYSLFQQRYKLHKEVYQNKKVLSIVSMISDIIIKSVKFLNLENKFKNKSFEWLFITDDILNYIKYNNKDDEVQNIFKRLYKRKLYKIIKNDDKFENKNILYKKNIVLSLSSNKDNPFKNIKFFKSNDNNKYYNIDIKNISKIISNNFFEINEYFIIK